MSRYPSRRLMLVAGAVVIAGTIAAMAIINNPTPTPAAVEGVCQTQLGAEWEMRGLIKHPTLDHYDVQCTRSTGLLGSESEWITIPRGDE